MAGNLCILCMRQELNAIASWFRCSQRPITSSAYVVGLRQETESGVTSPESGLAIPSTSANGIRSIDQIDTVEKDHTLGSALYWQHTILLSRHISRPAYPRQLAGLSLDPRNWLFSPAEQPCGARCYSSSGGLSSLPVDRRADLMWYLNQQDTSRAFWVKVEEDISSDNMANTLLKPLIVLQKEIAELQGILDDAKEDEDMKRMAREELEGQAQELDQLRDHLIDQLLPRDEADDSGCILEVRAGTGGDEAALFALEVFGMYENMARSKGWKFEILDIANTELKGCKEASASISGRGAYGRFKYEIGVHRVQRVPVTEKSGRLHTSAISVAVLPEASEVDVQIRDEDLRIDTYRSGGAGGQSVNTTSSAVRVTHVPSGVVVAIQDERSQHKNKAKALKVLRARLYDLERQKLASSRSEQRSEQIGSGDRSERIRTYNFPQGRVTDHRVGITQHNLEKVLATGELDDFVEALVHKQRQDAIAALLRTKQTRTRT